VAGVDTVWKWEELQARKRLEKRADSPLSDALLGGGVVDESPIYALLANSRLNPIDFLLKRWIS
jgi:hypothetical protein